jgi:hypothetical protein
MYACGVLLGACSCKLRSRSHRCSSRPVRKSCVTACSSYGTQPLVHTQVCSAARRLFAHLASIVQHQRPRRLFAHLPSIVQHQRLAALSFAFGVVYCRQLAFHDLARSRFSAKPWAQVFFLCWRDVVLLRVRSHFGSSRRLDLQSSREQLAPGGKRVATGTGQRVVPDPLLPSGCFALPPFARPCLPPPR